MVLASHRAWNRRIRYTCLHLKYAGKHVVFGNVWIWSTLLLYRSLFLRFNKVHSLHGVSAYRYRLSQDLFGRNHENECFCKPALDDDQPPNCPPDGTIDLQPCYKGPILLSNPHFLYADKKLQEYVTGVKPTVDEHSSFVDIEPVIFHNPAQCFFNCLYCFKS